MDELLSLKWKNHCSTFIQLLGSIRQMDLYTDVTLSCSGKFFNAHKVVLTACSDYFKEVFTHTDCKNPVIIMKDISSEDLESLLDYMYIGEVNVNQGNLGSLIKAAECLQIKGLAVADTVPPKNTIPSKYIYNSDDKRKRKFNFSEHNSNYRKPSPKLCRISSDGSSPKNSSSDINMIQMDRDCPTGTVTVKQEKSVCVVIADENNLIDSNNEEIKFRVDENKQTNLESVGYNPNETASTSFNIKNIDSETLMEGRISSFISNFQKDPQPDWGTNNLEPSIDNFVSTDNLTIEKDISEEHHTTCPYCYKKFSAVSSLHRHILIHTGEKSFMCNNCSYSTNRKDSLNRHMFMMHTVMGKKNNMFHFN